MMVECWMLTRFYARLSKGGFEIGGKFGPAQNKGFNGVNGGVLREEVKREARGFFQLSHSPTLPLSPSPQSKFKTHSR